MKRLILTQPRHHSLIVVTLPGRAGLAIRLSVLVKDRRPVNDNVLRSSVVVGVTLTLLYWVVSNNK